MADQLAGNAAGIAPGTLSATAVPEPALLALRGMGLVGVALARREHAS